MIRGIEGPSIGARRAPYGTGLPGALRGLRHRLAQLLHGLGRRLEATGVEAACRRGRSGISARARSPSRRFRSSISRNDRAERLGDSPAATRWRNRSSLPPQLAEFLRYGDPPAARPGSRPLAGHESHPGPSWPDRPGPAAGDRRPGTTVCRGAVRERSTRGRPKRSDIPLIRWRICRQRPASLGHPRQPEETGLDRPHATADEPERLDDVPTGDRPPGFDRSPSGPGRPDPPDRRPRRHDRADPASCPGAPDQPAQSRDQALLCSGVPAAEDRVRGGRAPDRHADRPPSRRSGCSSTGSSRAMSRRWKAAPARPRAWRRASRRAGLGGLDVRQ